MAIYTVIWTVPSLAADLAAYATHGAAIGFAASITWIDVLLHTAPLAHSSFTRLFITTVLAGILASLIIGVLQPAFTSAIVAMVAGFSAVLIFLLIVTLSNFGFDALTTEHAAMILGASLVGIAIALFVREATGYDVSDREPESITDFLNRRSKPHVSRHRTETRAKVFPPEWRGYLAENVRLYAKMNAEDRTELEKQVLVFLDEKRFEGCNGVAVTDEMRVTIAAYACILSLHLDAGYYPKLRTILIYPDTYVPRHPDIGPHALVRDDDPNPRLGESWNSGVVVLSWADISNTIRNGGDGRQLIYHEFAHQLDGEDGRSDGVPLLRTVEEYKTWTEVLETEYARHVAAVNNGGDSVIREYGATNEAEFFAVATEAFFENGAQLKAAHPRLYDVLKNYYEQDPS